jgi:phospholipase/carboxylesterase
MTSVHLSAADKAQDSSIVVQHPSGRAEHLFLLFHGVGATAESFLPVAKLVANQFPQSAVVCVSSPFECDLGAGRQWFSVSGISEENRPKRISDAIPIFIETIERWQTWASVNPAQTTLIGFSQGAIIALQASKSQPIAAGRVVSHSGRFAPLPTTMSPHVKLHLIHGENDDVVSHDHITAATQRLNALSADFTVDSVNFLGHHMNTESIQLMLDRLKKLF